MKELSKTFLLIWLIWTIFCFIVSYGLMIIAQYEFFRKELVTGVPSNYFVGVIPIDPLWFLFSATVLIGGQIPFLLYVEHWYKRDR